MAKRFRYYYRQGWHSIKLPRANLWGINGPSREDPGNEAHFKQLNQWCSQSFPPDSWSSRYRNWEGEKEFVFKEQKHTNWFGLKWL